MTLRRILITLTLCSVTLTPFAQQRKTTRQQSTQQRKTTPAKKAPAAKKGTAKKASGKGKGNAKLNVPTTAEIKGLQNQRSQIQRNINEQQRKLQVNKVDVQQRLKNLVTINGEITAQQQAIEGYQKEVNILNGDISQLTAQRTSLEAELKDKQRRFMQSMQYMSSHRNLQDRMRFVFSAKSLPQAYRRMRFMREYAAYQRKQGEQIKRKQQQIDEKNKQLATARNNKNAAIAKGREAENQLKVKQDEQQRIVKDLQNKQKEIQGVIAEQQKKQASLNAQIDRLVAIEVEKARKRAAEEARQRAAAIAAEKKRREEALARQRAEAERKRQENERRIAEAKRKEAEAAEAARAAAAADAAEKAAREQAAREAKAQRMAAERKAEADNKREEHNVAVAEKAAKESTMEASADRRISGSFESNRGRLPMPITGSYSIVSHFGQNNVEGLRNVTLDNKGINIKGQPGAQARSVFEGEVSAVFSFQGQMVVMVRHGAYISVYCNLRSVNVVKGQKVSTRQPLGTVGADNILQFQLRKETAKLNPEAWLGR